MTRSDDVPDEPAIRPFDPADGPRLEEIRRAAFAPVFASFRRIAGDEIAALALAHEEADQIALLEGICRGEGGAVLLVAEIGGEAAGFASFTVDEARGIGEIGLAAVHPDHAGRGVGTRLCRAALAAMRERGMAVAAVATGGDPSHAPARRAYEKAGFGHALPSATLYRRL